jgi:hypothetical protein
VQTCNYQVGSNHARWLRIASQKRVV